MTPGADAVGGAVVSGDLENPTLQRLPPVSIPPGGDGEGGTGGLCVCGDLDSPSSLATTPPAHGVGEAIVARELDSSWFSRIPPGKTRLGLRLARLWSFCSGRYPLPQRAAERSSSLSTPSPLSFSHAPSAASLSNPPRRPTLTQALCPSLVPAPQPRRLSLPLVCLPLGVPAHISFLCPVPPPRYDNAQHHFFSLPIIAPSHPKAFLATPPFLPPLHHHTLQAPSLPPPSDCSISLTRRSTHHLSLPSLPSLCFLPLPWASFLLPSTTSISLP